MYARAVAVWLLLIAAEVLNGTLRTVFITPRLGDMRARQVGVFIGSALFLALGYASAPWLRARRTPDQFAVGVLWVVLTVAFEVGLGRYVFRYPWDRIASDYDLPHGGLLPLGLVALALTPWLVSRLRRV